MAGAGDFDRRLILVSGLAVAIAVAAGFLAQLLTALIAFITNLAFFGRLSTTFTSPATHHLGGWVVLVPIAGALIVGVLARYGSAGIRGHGIPEAMEQILTNQSRMSARLTVLKPLSAAIAIGTGGPFGAEGPIIATGGALGSLVGQVLRTSADERKTLLAAGAAAGMAATFGSPVAAVLLAVELLLFEFRPRSLLPVALSAAVATGVRIAFVGSTPVFGTPSITQPSDAALFGYIVIGGLVGVVAVGVTWAVYAMEDAFEHVRIHWMWWPALGAVAVGVIALFAPRTLGVGYDNIADILAGRIVGGALITLFVLKFVSWCVALGSGTSGGTLAPLFTVGGGLGAALGASASYFFPHAGFDPRIAALVGMAAMFAGASRAFLASVVLAFETTRQPLGLLPLLGGCTLAVLLSYLLMEHTIMTKKIARRGVRVIGEYGVDYLEQVVIRDQALRTVVTLQADDALVAVRDWLARGGPGTSHQGFPVLTATGTLAGVVTRRDLFAEGLGLETPVRDLIKRPPVVIYDDCSFREAADTMVVSGVGRLPVVSRAAPGRVIGIITRSDLLAAHAQRLEEATVTEQGFELKHLWAE
ncbi:MAG TPA: chloride channel protein [Gemmatimonadales bacterium]|nr:chloride channel protein [Gemmatimonadales bacterium]